MARKECTAKIIIDTDGTGGAKIEIEGPDGTQWLGFRVHEKTVDMNMRAINLMEPFNRRITKMLRADADARKEKTDGKGQ